MRIGRQPLRRRAPLPKRVERQLHRGVVQQPGADEQTLGHHLQALTLRCGTTCRMCACGAHFAENRLGDGGQNFGDCGLKLRRACVCHADALGKLRGDVLEFGGLPRCPWAIKLQ